MEFKDLQLPIILPHHMKDPTEIIARRKAWIERKWSQIQEAIKNSVEAEGFMIFGEKYTIENVDVNKPEIDNAQKKITLNPRNQNYTVYRMYLGENVLGELLQVLRLNQYYNVVSASNHAC